MSMLQLVSECMLLLGLAFASFEDIHTGRISLLTLIILMPAGLVLQLIDGKYELYELLLGSCLGGILLIISLLSKGSLGIGDSLIFVVSGVFLGLCNNLILLLISLGISAVASIILMITLKLKGKSRIPFLPFILSGYICLLLLGN